MCSTPAPAVDETVLHAMSDADLLAEVAALVAEQNRVAARLTAAVRVADARQASECDGLRTMVSWLRGHARLQPAAASRLVRNGRALAHLPAVESAFASGAVSAEQVTVAARVVAPERLAQAAEQGVDLGEIDRALAGVATAEPFPALEAAVEHYLARLDPDGPEPDPTEKRSLRMTRHADGSVSGWFDLDAVGGARVSTALESVVQAGRCAGDERSRGQQMADALVQLADNALASGQLPVVRTRKPQVGVLVGVHDLADPATGGGAATLETGGIVSAARARWLACDGEIGRIVMGPAGVPIELGRTKRVVDPYLRRAVDLRDGHCVFAGCTAPASWCQAHHVLHWLFGGKTELENLALLCERHHGKVHHGYRVERQPDGTWRTWRPDGSEIVLGGLLLTAV